MQATLPFPRRFCWPPPNRQDPKPPVQSILLLSNCILVSAARPPTVYRVQLPLSWVFFVIVPSGFVNRPRFLTFLLGEGTLLLPVLGLRMTTPFLGAGLGFHHFSGFFFLRGPWCRLFSRTYQLRPCLFVSPYDAIPVANQLPFVFLFSHLFPLFNSTVDSSRWPSRPTSPFFFLSLLGRARLVFRSTTRLSASCADFI